MAKNLLQLFNKYEPSGYRREWMSEGEVLSVRADKDQRLLEVKASLKRLVDKEELYLAEADLKAAYELNFVKILPSYPSAFLTSDYIPQIFREAGNFRVEVRCFFDGCTYILTENSLSVTVRFPERSVQFIQNSNTPHLIKGIIKSEFDKDVEVTIFPSEEDASPDTFFGEDYFAELQRLDSQLSVASRDYEKRAAAANSPEKDAPKAPVQVQEEEKLPRAATLFENVEPIRNDDGIVRIGSSAFDTNEAEYVIGNAFPITPSTIASLDDGKRHADVVIVGEVFKFTSEPTRKGDKFNTTFAIFDGNASIESRSFLTAEEHSELASVAKVGNVLALHGYVKHEQKKLGGVDDDMNFHYTDVAKIKKLQREDKHPEKRIELHLHTNMSAMDSVIGPDVAIKTAKKFGMPAIAITDHGNVQGYPEAMLASEKLGDIKVIYGLEAYFVNDMSSALIGDYNGKLTGKAVVFDIETTGFSHTNSRIIEIGAVKIDNGQVIEVFDEFVNPGVHIPEEITKLTSINDEMVADADPINVVLKKFLDFAGDGLLIAHNANFDVGFIRYSCEQNGFEFKNPYLDTLALSRFLNTDLKSHKLDAIAKYYALEDFHHHRASDDAEILAKIYFCMVGKLEKYNITDFSQLNEEMSLNSDPLKLPTYHQILLVKNKTGLKNLYRLISKSYLDYYRRNPRIPKSELVKYREGLIIGSACEAGELYRAILDGFPDSDIEAIVDFYDYLEIQPISNNHFLVVDGKVGSDDELRAINKRIVELGKKFNKPVVATCDAHFVNPEDEIFRKILLAGMKFKDASKDTYLYLRTTEEMLEEFSYLGEEDAYNVVIKNTNLIADMIEKVRPIPEGTFTPKMEGAEEELQEMCWNRARSMYGDNLPELVEKRLAKELESIIKHGFAVLYIIAQRLVYFSEQNGYLVGSRGSVGSSFVATMAGISEVNPLPPHYWCPNCRHNEFFTDGSVGSGFDLPDKNCPECGTKMNCDGHDIPFETFLGFYGDKSPDIDLNFASGELQGKVHKYTEELFGSQNVFRAGTLGTLADKTAYGFVMKYLEEKQISVSRAEVDRLVNGCVGVKRTTGQHPGGIIVVPQEYEVYDFTPVQHPADDPNSSIVTTHFAFSYLHDTILKLDELGHDIPAKYKLLEKFSGGMNVMDVPMNDRAVYELFQSTKPLGITPEALGGVQVGTFGLPEFGTAFVQPVVLESKPRTFADLLQVSGLTHGTDVWLGNAQDLIKNGICDISQVIGTRDGIMLDLIRYGLENGIAFKIMESVRKGRGLTPDWIEEMRKHDVPEWYIESCLKIKYMFPKAHAAAYVMSAIRVGWFKVHMPVAFYCAMFTSSVSDFDASIALPGKANVFYELNRIKKLGREASQKEQGMVSTLELMNECLARGIKFLPVSLTESAAKEFLPAGDHAIRLPFLSLNGLGETAALRIVEEREKSYFFSVDDLQTRAALNKSVVEILREQGVLDGLQETDQISMF